MRSNDRRFNSPLSALADRNEILPGFTMSRQFTCALVGILWERGARENKRGRDITT